MKTPSTFLRNLQEGNIMSARLGRIFVWILITAILILFMVFFVLSKNSGKTNVLELQDLAHKLGYVPEVHIVQYSTRWNIFPVSHGEVLYYTTHASLEQFQKLLEGLTASQEPPATGDGYDLFSVNYSTNHILTINGKNGASDRTITPEPTAYRWRIFYDNRYWNIIYYQIANDGQLYQFDKKPIGGNVVTILLQID